MDMQKAKYEEEKSTLANENLMLKNHVNNIEANEILDRKEEKMQDQNLFSLSQARGISSSFHSSDQLADARILLRKFRDPLVQHFQFLPTQFADTSPVLSKNCGVGTSVALALWRIKLDMMKMDEY